MRIGSISLFFLFAAQSHAETEISTATQKVLVTGSQTDMDANRDNIAGKLVLGKQRIADSGVQTVGDLLRREPAISIGKDGRLGLLGLPGYTQVLVDGLPPQGDPFAIDPAHVERIEIIKSTTAATGPVGIAGTINIIRRKAERKALTQGSIGANSTGGRAGASLSWMNNQIAADSPLIYNLTMSASRRQTPATSRYVETRTMEGTAPALEFEGESSAPGVFDIVMAGSEFAWTPTAGHKISFLPDIGSFKTTTDIDEQRRWHDGSSLSIAQDGAQTMNSWSLPLRWNWQIDDDSAMALALKMNRLQLDIDSPRREAWSNAPVQLRKNEQQRDSRNYFADLDFNTTLEGGHEITAGAKLVRNHMDIRYDNTVDGIPDASVIALGTTAVTRMDSDRLFLQDEWRVNKTLAINAGLSVERTIYAFKEGPVRSRMDFNMWSPSIHLSKKIGGDRKRQFRLSLARSFQPPSADQMLLHPVINRFVPCQPGQLCGANGIDTADSAGNPRLQPERALGLNLSYAHGIGSGSEVLVEWYARDIQDKTGWEYALENVAWAAAPRYVYRPANLGQAKVSGANLEWRLAGKDIAKNAATLEAHGSLGFARSELSDVLGPDNRIAGQSPWHAKLGGSYTLKAVPLKLGTEFNVLPADWVRNNASQRVYQSSRRTLGINGTWKIDAKSKLTVNLDNLLHKSTTRIEEFQAGPALLRWSTVGADYARMTIKFDTAL